MSRSTKFYFITGVTIALILSGFLFSAYVINSRCERKMPTVDEIILMSDSEIGAHDASLARPIIRMLITEVKNLRRDNE